MDGQCCWTAVQQAVIQDPNQRTRWPQTFTECNFKSLKKTIRRKEARERKLSNNKLEADVREEVKEDEQKMKRFDLRLLLLLLQGYTLLPGGQHFVEGVDADSRSGQTTVRKDIMTVATSEATPPSKATDIRSLGFSART